MQIFGYIAIAKRYGVAKQTIYNWISRGYFISPRKLGGRYYWETEDLKRWEDEKGIRPRQG